MFDQMQHIVIKVKQILSLYFSNRNFTENKIAGYEPQDERREMGKSKYFGIQNIGIDNLNIYKIPDICHNSPIICPLMILNLIFWPRDVQFLVSLRIFAGGT